MHTTPCGKDGVKLELREATPVFQDTQILCSPFDRGVRSGSLLMHCRDVFAKWLVWPSCVDDNFIGSLALICTFFGCQIRSEV